MGLKTKLFPFAVSIYKVLKIMGLPHDKQYTTIGLKKPLTGITTMSIISENAFWDKARTIV